MTPKEKADELFTHYYSMIQSIGGELGQEILVSILAKQSALIAVDEIINHHHQSQGLYRIDRYFWEQVKKEIQSI